MDAYAGDVRFVAQAPKMPRAARAPPHGAPFAAQAAAPPSLARSQFASCAVWTLSPTACDVKSSKMQASALSREYAARRRPRRAPACDTDGDVEEILLKFRKSPFWEANAEDPGRFDFPKTADYNELVKHHGHKLDSFLVTVVRLLVHPLHNFLQYHHGLDNEDEIQLMLVPILTEQYRFDAFFASNADRITQTNVRRAVKGWGVMLQLKIRSVKVVRGSHGEHAEQKLLVYLRSVLRYDGSRGRALIVGERLPCAVCKLFSVPFEDIAKLFPSHGHFYVKVVAKAKALLECEQTLNPTGTVQISWLPEESFRLLSKSNRVILQETQSRKRER
jgi:hypothetical protein